MSLAGARSLPSSATHYDRPRDTVQQLLLGAIEDISEVGATRFSPVTLCARLRVPPSLVNYHFSSRMGLILDASVLAYEQYVEGQELALEEPTPESQLTYWIEAQVQWTIKHSGIASVLNFPGLTGPSNAEFTLEHQSRLSAGATKNMQLLSTIVGRIQGIPDAATLMTPEKLAGFPAVSLATAMIGWLTLGHAVWRSGHHLPTSSIEVIQSNTERVFALVAPTALTIARNAAAVVGSQGIKP